MSAHRSRKRSRDTKDVSPSVGKLRRLTEKSDSKCNCVMKVFDGKLFNSKLTLCKPVSVSRRDAKMCAEITIESMQCVIDFLVEDCEFTCECLFLDIGSGGGKPSIHVAKTVNPRISLGVEIDNTKHQQSLMQLEDVIQRRKASPEVSPVVASEQHTEHTLFVRGDVSDLVTTDPFTHVYMCDLDFPHELLERLAHQFNHSHHGRYLASYHPPHFIVSELGVDVALVGAVSTRLQGSYEQHTCYFYKRLSLPPSLARPPHRDLHLLALPERPDHPGEEATVVYCDPLLSEACRLAASVDDSALLANVSHLVSDFLQSGRPKRK